MCPFSFKHLVWIDSNCLRLPPQCQLRMSGGNLKNDWISQMLGFVNFCFFLMSCILEICFISDDGNTAKSDEVVPISS